MENMQNQTEAFHPRPSIELPIAKKPKHMTSEKSMTPRTPEIIHGNNRYGSKGTIRCEKCQRRKGKCIFENFNTPCDYCFARGLPCGPKLPTPRKLAELRGFNAAVPMAMGQHLPHGHLSGQLHVQIPVTVSSQFNLSSEITENDIPPFAISRVPSNNNGYRAYSGTAGLASLIAPLSLGLAVPQSPCDMGWSQESTPQGSTPSPQFSPTMPHPKEFRRCGSAQPYCIPPRHPAHTLNASILPIVAAAIPNFQTTPNDAAQAQMDEESLKLLESWLVLDGTQSSHINGEIMHPLRLKWNRLLHMPKSMMGRKLAGKWDDNKVKTEEPESVKSIKSAPSILL